MSEWELHRPGAVGLDGRPHERSNPQVVQRLREILEPTRSTTEHELEFQSDEDTTWFAAGRDSTNQPILQDYGRFATLMSDNQTPDNGNRYPQLVSFIGQTGPRKSTLIKMLIDRFAMLDRGAKYPSPVTSSNNDRVPTTSDVHLYADPISYNTQAPVLYADFEGLDGGEAVPAGLRHRTKGKEALGILSDVTNVMGKTGLGKSPKPSTASRSSGVINTSSKWKFGESRYASQRDLEWAITTETKKREYVVTQVYARLLYTFSNVVVFVLRNPRVFKSTVLDKLLEWGSASIDKSLNQPALSHAVIVLNTTDNVGAIFREPRFEEQARLWQDIGRTINTTKDCIDCYYALISVIRVPSRGRYMLMDDQMEKLFELINKRCQVSLLTKKHVRMLATADKLQVDLHVAYDHFSRDLDTPFDFVKEALKHNPIPQDFSGNILNLAI
ncbi:hypothetical protein BDP55DRAFT_758767 [Colletotrichum godetiae]|uniref:Uncharacterized protein n=1 Tax=Colletotrichum godetiae TaxID=1209918 RepID=A0AAJ0A8F7_9PEZI|nr:uncharacterized protein BDP55DRAFT_758767 [Colletotrichum godetiae]KAK1658449.1 hypothetical protein BDP55DRAFT_758767 [Colletotrichum godetiae]